MTGSTTSRCCNVETALQVLEPPLAKTPPATDRAMRSVSHQMHSAKFPAHRDLAGFDFEASPVLLSKLYEHTSVLITTNLTFEGG